MSYAYLFKYIIIGDTGKLLYEIDSNLFIHRCRKIMFAALIY